MGHVAHHCEAKWKKVSRPNSVIPLPKSSVKRMSATLNKIWIAKDAHAGGGSGGTEAILDTR
jgi:hypothetical protein